MQSSLLATILLLGCTVTQAAPTEGWPNVRPLTDRTFASSPARLARGEYLAEGLLQCFVCHSERDWGRPGAPPKPGMKGAGAVVKEMDGRRIVAPNITPHRQTGAGKWTDDMLARAIREGVAHDGRPLHPQMWYGSFRRLSDEDLAGVIVYLRSIRAIDHALPRTALPDAELRKIAKELKPVTTPVAAPDLSAPVLRGTYLMELADCSGCHTSWYSERQPGVYAGGNLIERGERKAYSTNITPHSSGVGYGRDTFIQIMRTGKFGTLSPLMPWIAFRNLDDQDLGAIHAALQTAHPVAHTISNSGEATTCPVCLQRHGAGDVNAVELPKAVVLAPEALAEFAGRYYLAEYDETIVITVDAASLWMVEGDDKTRLTPVGPLTLVGDGLLAPVLFERTRGRISGFREKAPGGATFERVGD